MPDFFYETFLGNRVIDYCVAALVLIGGALAVWLAQRLIIGRLKALAARTTSKIGSSAAWTIAPDRNEQRQITKVK